MFTIVVLCLNLVPRSLQLCAEEFFPLAWDDTRNLDVDDGVVVLGEDETGGCVCKQKPGVYTLCRGETCRSIPKGFNISTRMFVFKSSQIVDINPGDLDVVKGVESLVIECNYNLTRVANGSFYEFGGLKNLSVSYNAKLNTLEKGCFDGLEGLQRLKLVRNGFTTLIAVTASLANLANLLNLDLSENSFQVVEREDFRAVAATSVMSLNLTSCQIESLHPQAFNPLRKLVSLHLGKNDLRTASIAAALEEVTLDLLTLTSAGLRKTTTNQLLEAIVGSNVSKLCLAGNQFERVTQKMFPRMPQLRVLDLSEVSATVITDEAFATLPELTALILKGNNLEVLPKGVLLKQLTYLDLRQTLTTSPFNPNGKNNIDMPKLEVLRLGSNRLYSLHGDDLSGMRSLRVLEMENGYIERIESGTFAALSQLEVLNLQNNPFVINRTWSDGGLFVGLTRLKTLLLGGCSITSFQHTLKSLGNLQFLGLERNKLIVFPNFQQLPKLRSVDLKENNLQPWTSRVFSQNHYLKEVNLGSNKLTHLTPFMLEDFQQLQKLNLTNNPITCDCSLEWATNLIGFEALMCAFPKVTYGLTIRQFLYTTHYCLNFYLVIPLVILAFLIVVIASSIYYFRWYLKYYLFLTRLHLRRTLKISNMKPPTGHINYLYDAFVSYSSEDRDFVVLLMQMLENHPPYISLCVYERDFEIGTMISENILESVSRSRKTILVISDSYAKSKWCQMECQLAEFNRLFRKHEDGRYVSDNVIFIKLGKVKDANLTPMLKYLLKTRIYLQWEVGEKKQKIFWEKLRKVLVVGGKMDETRF